MTTFRRPALVAALIALLALAACQEQGSAAAEAQPTPPPSPVGVVDIEPEAIPVISDLPGRIAPTRIAEVRPRVGGIIVERVFEQGTDVRQGDPLFRIDRATYEVSVQAAEAAVAKAEAMLIQARQGAERTQALLESRTSSRANYDVAIANQRSAEADLASARAQLRAAQIDLDYTTVRAPISGRIGRALVTEGTLVNTTDAQALATIQQLDPVYADIQQPVSELLRLRNALATGAIRQLEPDVAQVRLRFDNGAEFPQAGRLLFSEATVEPTSGQVTLRAEFPNADDTLLPGLYVRVGVDQGVDPDALAVPNQAIQRDAAGQSLLYFVNADEVVDLRPVVTGQVVGTRTVIIEGLAAGDRIVADGFQKIAPGAKVAPEPWSPVGDAAKGLGGGDGNKGAVGVGAPKPSAAAPALPPAPGGEARAETAGGDAATSVR